MGNENWHLSAAKSSEISMQRDKIFRNSPIKSLVLKI